MHAHSGIQDKNQTVDACICTYNLVLQLIETGDTFVSYHYNYAALQTSLRLTGCLSCFCLCGKICELNQLKKKNSLYFVLEFLRIGLIALGLWWYGTSLWKYRLEGTCFTSWQPEAKRRRAGCPDIFLKGMSQWPYCLLKGLSPPLPQNSM